MEKPLKKPGNPNFSSGPTAKRPGWNLAALGNAWLSRSHRAKGGKARLQAAQDWLRSNRKALEARCEARFYALHAAVSFREPLRGDPHGRGLANYRFAALAVLVTFVALYLVFR